MPDSFNIISLPRLLNVILDQLNHGHFFGIRESLFFRPKNKMLSDRIFDRNIDTPLGVAAGPHTQLAQNIAGAWLCGARYIELKTIQTLDELSVSKPCIDMQDEGYNCEWSQELKLNESFDQYLNAWIIIHILHHRMGFSGHAHQGTVFNMSAGYNLEGILKPNVQEFFARIKNCNAEKSSKIESIRHIYPDIDTISIPDCISDNITLSTMHGCPPGEIEKIGKYLIEEKNLHTIVKLNPTLLGPEFTRKILNEKLGFKTPVPDEAFNHDLQYGDALQIITSLDEQARVTGVQFGIKLTNTLESLNFKRVFPENEKQMYMSGRALHPLAMNLAAKLRLDLGSSFKISFSAGADCFNIADILSCKLHPVTVCSDLLKPGGYGRLKQYTDILISGIQEEGYPDLQDYISGKQERYIDDYAHQVLDDAGYKKAFRESLIKTRKVLGFFDCIHAPCVNTCPTNQDIPDYMYYVSRGEFEKAFEVILRTNPFPSVTGAVCDHDCQTRCTRINYDDVLAIREVKRYVTSLARENGHGFSLPENGLKAAVIGAGPSGLSCAYFLRLAGFDVDVYEEKSSPGGMVSGVIPAFRLPLDEIEKDIKRITGLGVKIKYNSQVGKDLFTHLRQEYPYLYIAVGARKSKRLGLPGENNPGITDPLEFLAAYKKGLKLSGIKNILVIGGGNTAMDVARSARKVADTDAKVSIVYRRRMEDMPAGTEEIVMTKHEGIEIVELAGPKEILVRDGLLKGIRFVRMKTAGTGLDGRQNTVPIEGVEFDLNAEVVFPCIGQEVIVDFADQPVQAKENTYATAFPGVYIGGDARRGASNIIGAIADGRKAAGEIIGKAKAANPEIRQNFRPPAMISELMVKKSMRVRSQLYDPAVNPVQGLNIARISTPEQAVEEASRCLLCDEICNVCVSVCPNFANYSYRMITPIFEIQEIVSDEDGIKIVSTGRFPATQEYQILNIADFCNDCGNCNTFCPTAGAPYTTKPSFYLTREGFDRADKGYYIQKTKDNISLLNKDHDRRYALILDTDHYYYEDESIMVKFEKENFVIADHRFKNKAITQVNLGVAAQMRILLHGAESLYGGM